MALTLLLPLLFALNQSPAANPPEVSPGVYQIGDGVTSPVLKKQVRPKYTQDAKNAKIEGVVLMSVIVGKDGRVMNVHVLKSLDSVHGLDNQAFRAVKEWKFAPGKKDGKPVAVQVTIEMTFTLK